MLLSFAVESVFSVYSIHRTARHVFQYFVDDGHKVQADMLHRRTAASNMTSSMLRAAQSARPVVLQHSKTKCHCFPRSGHHCTCLMSHSMPSFSPSPLFAQHGWICHGRSRMAGRDRLVAICSQEFMQLNFCIFSHVLVYTTRNSKLQLVQINPDISTDPVRL